ncbi:DUF3306 domain-containing protein [Roseobacter sp. A03A-229]
MTDVSSFWARRRAAVQAEAEADARAEDAAQAAAVQAGMAEKDDETVLEEMGLPDPDAMQPGDDFAAFMAKDVPTHLRNKALRKLWRSNPVLACVDGLNEYDDDFRAAMLAGGPIQTAYQVGKGMMSHLEEMARQEEQAARADEDVLDDETVEVAPEDHEEPVQTTATVVAEAENEEFTTPKPRRMQFRFEEADA